MRLYELIKSDLTWYTRLSPIPIVNVFARCIITPGFLATVIIRVQEAVGRHSQIAAALIKVFNYYLTGVEWSVKGSSGPRLHIPHPSGVTVGHGVTVGAGVTIFQHVSVGTRALFDPAKHRWPVLEDDCVIGVGACVLGEVTIGARTIVGANAVVIRDVGADSIYYGFPG